MRSTGIFLLFSILTLSWDAVCQTKPKKPYVLFEEAESAFRDNDLNTALNLLNQCLKADPGYLEAYSMRGSVRELLNDNDGALTDYSIYLEQFPDRSEVLMSRAILRYKIGFFDQARDDFHRILVLPPPGETNSILYKKVMSVDDKNPMITMSPQGNHTSYILNYLGLTEAKLKNYERAKAHLDSAILLNPGEPDYFVNRGLMKESLDDSTALLDYQAALKLNPNHVLAKHNLKAYQSRKAQSQNQEERLSQTIAADSTMLYPYLERAQQRFESKYYEGAAEDYSMALEIDSTNVEIWLGRGLAREKLKDYKGAFSDYTKAIELKENFSKAWLNRGNVLLKMERYADAVEDYTVSLLYFPDYSTAFYNRAMAKIKLKQHQEACADLTRAEALGMKVDEKLKQKTCSK
jgi:tetratricopeptide (TPR) repeat protein